MKVHIIEEASYDNEMPAFVTTDLDVARMWALERLTEHKTWRITTADLETGEVEDEPEWVSWRPEPYRGPLERRKVSLRGDNGRTRGFVHRVPIECLHPGPTAELTESNLWRILASEHCGEGGDIGHRCEWGECHCGGWQIIEGEPETVRKLAEDHPPR